MAGRKRSSAIEDWFDLVSMLPWWAGVLLALVSYAFMNGVATGESTPTDPAHIGSAMVDAVLHMLATIGQYVVPVICLGGAAASAIAKIKCREGAALPPLELASTGKATGSKSEGRWAFAFQMFLAGVVVLVVPRLSDSELVQNIFGPLKLLGYTMMLVGCVISMMALWTLVFRDGNAASSPELVEMEKSGSPAPWQPDANWDPERDRLAAGYRSALDAAEKPGAPANLETARDVERMLDLIEWRRFEAVVERCFQVKGFSTSTQAHGADGGVDIKLFQENDPDTLAGVVQCKHWGRQYVGVEVLRALRGSMAAFGASKGYFVTSSTYTPDAAEFAAGNQIETTERDSLVAMIMSFTVDQRETVLKVALSGRYDVPTCASCGTKMVKRAPRRGGREFWGCVSYPRCRSVIKIRRVR